MAQDTAFQKRIQRIGEMVERLESSADPNFRAMSKELIESLMALHGAALERMLELTSEAGEAGEGIIQKCGHDELVSSLLLLYGLHPENLQSRVARALENVRPFLDAHGANAELDSIGDDGIVNVRLHVKSSGCGSSAASLKVTLEAALEDAAPDAASIVVQETGELMRSGFVSVAQLEGGISITTLAAGRAARSGG